MTPKNKTKIIDQNHHVFTKNNLPGSNKLYKVLVLARAHVFALAMETKT